MAVRNLAFENLLVRVVERDGEPWFVAADVCRALDIQNASSAVKILDEDERSKFFLGRQGDGLIISESGLYTLMMRCRDALKDGTPPHRFRKWVTQHVLPTIRKEGRFELVTASEETPVTETADDLERFRLNLQMVREARIVFGARAARRAWELAGLPDLSDGTATASVGYSPLAPSVADWMAARTVAAPGHRESARELYDDYVAWCAARGIDEIVSQAGFGRSLGTAGAIALKSGDGRRVRVGLKLVEGEGFSLN